MKDWLDNASYEIKATQKEFILSILDEAWKNHGVRDRQPRLFAHNNSDPATRITATGLPFTFIDLFAGIGGFRMGLEQVGGRCVFSSEWDKYAQKTYQAWFGETPEGDIRKITPSDIPDHDLLSAGFPCQPFSIAGVSKKKSLGKAHGFKDKAQGNLFFYVAKIIKEKRPPVIFLENVKNLKSHDKRQTWNVIKKTLEDLDYLIFTQVIDAADYVPQHRERIFIIGFDRRLLGEARDFHFPDKPTSTPPKFRDILESKVPDKYILTDHLWNYLQEYAEKHKAKGNGFGYSIADMDGVSRTLSARYYKDGSEILVARGKRKNPRRLSPRETARLMGFSDYLPIVVSDTQAYKQFGNAVVPCVVEAVAEQVVKVLVRHVLKKHRNGCLIKASRRSRSGEPSRKSKLCPA